MTTLQQFFRNRAIYKDEFDVFYLGTYEMLMEEKKISDIISKGDKKVIPLIREVVDEVSDAIDDDLRAKLERKDSEAKEKNAADTKKKKEQEKKEKQFLRDTMKENRKLKSEVERLKQLLTENKIQF
jgi:hypothetical protein